jgi:ankyrin repeat protein
VLHAAAAAGHRVVLELLLQNGASWQQTDAGGRSALHYALLHEAVGCAKLLLRRGGSQLAGMRDARGVSAMDVCLAKGKVEDEELFLLLSG